MFDKGMKVLCINDTFTEEAKKIVKHRPVVGNVYTIRYAETNEEGEAVYLAEIFNPPNILLAAPDCGKEPLFNAARFVFYRLTR